MNPSSEELKNPLKNADRRSGAASVLAPISLIGFGLISGKRIFQGMSRAFTT